MMTQLSLACVRQYFIYAERRGIADRFHTLYPTIHAPSCSVSDNEDIQAYKDDATDNSRHTEVIRNAYLFSRATGVCLWTGHCKRSQKSKSITPIYGFIAEKRK